MVLRHELMVYLCEFILLYLDNICILCCYTCKPQDTLQWYKSTTLPHSARIAYFLYTYTITHKYAILTNHILQRKLHPTLYDGRPKSILWTAKQSMRPLASHLQAVATSVHQIVKDMVSKNSSYPAHPSPRGTILYRQGVRSLYWITSNLAP